MPIVFLILIYLFLARKIAKALISSAQNFRENYVDFRYMRYVSLILILIISTRKVANTQNYLARDFIENNADFN
jgi:hypothetical protein